MQFNELQINIAKFLKKVSPIYQNYFLYKKIFREQFENGYKALVCFLKNYAYERQGAAAAYSNIIGESPQKMTQKVYGKIMKMLRRAIIIC